MPSSAKGEVKLRISNDYEPLREIIYGRRLEDALGCQDTSPGPNIYIRISANPCLMHTFRRRKYVLWVWVRYCELFGQNTCSGSAAASISHPPTTISCRECPSLGFTSVNSNDDRAIAFDSRSPICRSSNRQSI